MAETRWGLFYQTPQDAPDGPNLGKELATDVDERLWRAYPVPNGAARLALSGLGGGFLCHQQDDDSFWLWTGATWRQIGAPVGGGTSAAFGQWSAGTPQSFGTSGTEYPLALANEDVPMTGVTRSTKGVGHQWSVPAGAYLAAVTARFAAGGAGSRFVGLRTADNAKQFGCDQNDGGPNAATRTFTAPVFLSATTSLYVAVAQSSGGSLSTVATSGSQNPSGYVRMSLTRLA